MRPGAVEQAGGFPYNFNRLAGNCAELSKHHDELSLLDVGCDTGLAPDHLLKTGLGTTIKGIGLLNTSHPTLKKVAELIREWNVTFTINGDPAETVPIGNIDWFNYDPPRS